MMCPGCAFAVAPGFLRTGVGVKFMSFSHVIAFAALVVAGLGSSLTQAAEAPAPPAAPAAATPPPEAVAPAADAPGAPVKPGDATAGQAKSATCAACHGMDGNPASSQYPKLAGQHEDYITRQVEMFKSHKRDSAVMMGFVMSLSAQD